MARIENTVFISYRRADVYTALAVYENLKNQGYDVFFDYRSISSGDFEQIITSNIRARAHFLLILTPTALDRCNEPDDWLRREIEFAIDDKRNIVPLFFKGFRFGDPSVTRKLTGKLRNLSRYNGLNVHEDYFDEAMQRLRMQYLNIPLDTVLHPVSTEVQRVVRAEQVAADKALEQIEDVKELVKQGGEKPVQKKELPKPVAKRIVKSETARRLSEKTIPWRSAAILASGLLLVILAFWGGLSVWNKLSSATPESTRTSQPTALQTSQPIQTPLLAMTETMVFTPISTDTPSQPLMYTVQNGDTCARIAVYFGISIESLIGLNNLDSSCFLAVGQTLKIPGLTPTAGIAQTSVTATSLAIGLTMTGEDGMTLLYVPIGEFTMGSDNGEADEKPVHKVTLDAFWIDKTEVTNAMYAKCVQDGKCNKPSNRFLYNLPDYANHPVVYVSWNDAKAYCSWADRRLPTEAEWEKAASWDAKNQTKYVYPWGNSEPKVNLLNHGNSRGTSTETEAVGTLPAGASPYGALDMAGNVWEWVNDWYDIYPGGDASASSDFGQKYSVLRGGSWLSSDDDVRSANRDRSNPTNTSRNNGFRCAMSATP